MAGHSKFKNIMHRKGAQDAKRAKIFTKLLKEITVAIKSGGGPDPEFNPRLRTAINAAKAANVPKDRIDSAIEKAANPAFTDDYEEARYEGYSANGVSFIVEALTDNRNRTVADIRASFNKSGGKLVENGSVTFNFEKIGLIIYPKADRSFDKMFELVVEAEASDLLEDEDSFSIECKVDDLARVRDFMELKIGTADEASLVWKAINFHTLEAEEEVEKVVKLIDVLEDLDDVRAVYTNRSL